ncbi:glucosamine-6-phosphate deaminase [Cytobacillus purgationiresistens]|uniref:Glucosamine-6-phosphate deaminase n=1 Tax=Cytobacillus purgationiresistens TaxID=863449 RepID=A0ABU0AIC3_9BACI|nr:glucosamine-6-phosphate deaminase [Cytobacillus purgationiresistens]MDQ0271006.1 glucosamine-6-phosphate deaminase [Cytobacillus purgationiresistens]
MKFYFYDSASDTDQGAAKSFIKMTNGIATPKIGLATGNTPVGLYQCLVQAYNQKKISFKTFLTYNLDEYVGLTKDHPQSFAYFMNEHLFNGVDILEGNIHIPQGNVESPHVEAAKYEKLLEDAGALDVQILSIGLNGHIGFNEPGEKLHSKTHVIELTEDTRRVNSKSFPSFEEVPLSAITLGLGTIMKAKKILFIAKGFEKADIIQQAFEGPLTTDVPGSLLQLHPNIEVHLDKEAASKLARI